MKCAGTLRSLTAQLEKDLRLPPETAQMKVRLFKERVRNGVIEALGEWPQSTIESNTAVRERALPLHAATNVGLSELQLSQMVRYLVPQSMVDEAEGDAATKFRIIKPLLEALAPLRAELDALKASTPEELEQAQRDMIEQHYRQDKTPEHIDTMCDIYRLTVAAEDYVSALNGKVTPNRVAGVEDLSRHRLKKAERRLVSVLGEITNWDVPQAQNAVANFKEAIAVGIAIAREKAEALGR